MVRCGDEVLGFTRVRADNDDQTFPGKKRRVPVEASAFPIVVSGLARRQSGFAEKRRQQAVRIKRKHVGAVGGDPLSKRTIQQTDGGQREQLRFRLGVNL